MRFIKLQSIVEKIRMSKGKIFLFLIVGTLLTSCGNFSKIVIGEISGVSIKGLEDNALVVAVRLPVENPTMYKITVTELDSKVFMNDQYLGKIIMEEKIVFPAKSHETHEIDLNIRLANIFSAAITMMKLRSGQRIRFRLEGELTARSALLKRKIPFSEKREVVI